MTLLYLLFILLVLLGLALFLHRAMGVRLVYFLRPQPPRAPRPPVPDCSVPPDPVTLNKFDRRTTGGVFHAKNIILPWGNVVTLTSTLILVADNSLTIDGIITYAAAPVPPNAPVNIILVCLTGKVVINGTVGMPLGMLLTAPAGTSSVVTALEASATGGVGQNAGYIKLVAPGAAIDIMGRVQAQAGGDGGSATATGVAGLRNLTGGTAGAAGGQGGAGGLVCLCALDAINIGMSAAVFGGNGGGGGCALATAVNGAPAYAEGGPSNHGGDVLLHGLAPNAGTQVFNDGLVQGGSVQYGNTARAGGGNAVLPLAGGDAFAWGGRAGAGGSVHFDNCLVALNGVGEFKSWKGGAGGPADATGGNGGPFVGGTRGGNAVARGGDGGVDGPIPQIPMVDGSIQPGSLMTSPPLGTMGLAHGKGGDATALGGSGGAAGRVFGPGLSGTGDALGGTGSGGTAATGATAAAARGVAPAGGVATPASSTGTP